MKTRQNEKIISMLNSMEKSDIYSMLLFALYKLKENPDYLVLSELCYIINIDDLSKVLRLFGGMTIKIPELKDLRLLLKSLSLYNLVNIENQDLKESLKTVASDEFSLDDIKDTYAKLIEVMSNYEFRKK